MSASHCDRSKMLSGFRDGSQARLVGIRPLLMSDRHLRKTMSARSKKGIDLGIFNQTLQWIGPQLAGVPLLH